MCIVSQYQALCQPRFWHYLPQIHKPRFKIQSEPFFVDEIDAIGKARGDESGGSNEREQGLMQILYEMDGFWRNDKVREYALLHHKIKHVCLILLSNNLQAKFH